jgi:phage shock protein A
MGVMGRFMNFVKGLFWQGQRSLEQSNPEAVYEMAINKMKDQYQKMQTAVGRLAAERNKLRSMVEQKSKQLRQAEEELEGALKEAAAGNAEAQELGEDLLNEKDALDGELNHLRSELVNSEKMVSDYLVKLRDLESRTKQMGSKRDAMIAKLQSAQARKSFNDMMGGMSTASEEGAVADIDKYIDSVAAQADISDEMSGATRDEKRRQLREKVRVSTGKSKFQAMLEARQQAGADSSTSGVRATENKPGIG